MYIWTVSQVLEHTENTDHLEIFKKNCDRKIKCSDLCTITSMGYLKTKTKWLDIHIRDHIKVSEMQVESDNSSLSYLSHYQQWTKKQ